MRRGKAVGGDTMVLATSCRKAVRASTDGRHGRAGEWMSRPERLWNPTFAGTEPCFRRFRAKRPAAPVLAMRERSADRRVTTAGKAVGTSAAGPAAGPGENIVMENWRDCRGLPDNGHIHPAIGCNWGDLPEGSNREPWGELIEIPSG